jgi:hypothetical protein
VEIGVSKLVAVQILTLNNGILKATNNASAFADSNPSEDGMRTVEACDGRLSEIELQ